MNPEKSSTLPIKTISFGDFDLVVAPLFMDQIETLIETNGEPETPVQMRVRLWKIIQSSIENATGRSEEDLIGTLRRRLTFMQWRELLQVVMEVTGVPQLKLV